MTLAEKLKELRAKANLTQRDLASAVGVTSGFIAQIELGDRIPSLDVMLRLTGALQLKRAEQEELMQYYEQAQQDKLQRTLQTRKEAVREVLRGRGGFGRRVVPAKKETPSVEPGEVARALADNPQLREAYELVKTALADPALRENVIGALRAFAQVARKDET